MQIVAFNNNPIEIYDFDTGCEPVMGPITIKQALVLLPHKLYCLLELENLQISPTGLLICGQEFSPDWDIIIEDKE